ncbi:cation:proton antiporter [Paraflavisolibacter sp. H34]|uniref:cation:proton antiporter n=1 Tax=Huijunlia imazamoxiresistens TaxID=3127457 RepID=UPI0030166103
MSTYIIILVIIGLAALGMAWMPSISRKIKISYSVIYVILGILLYLAFGRLLPLPDPLSKNTMTLHLTELVVIVSLMGSGLKIDQPFSLRQWAVPLRLVSVTLVLSIAIVAALAMWVLHFDLASALLLGAVLAPTDPVLAADVQVGPPLEEARDNVKFALTAEAGMNDGTAFPFVWLAIALAAHATPSEVLPAWLWGDLLYKVVAGIVSGFLLGRLLAYLVFRLPEQKKYIVTKDGFVAISATLLVYGLTEMIHGYGFFAVFVAAVTLRNYEMHHKYHRKLHAFTDQIERILVAIVLLLFGGSLVSGVLDKLSWQMAVLGVVFVLFIRPLTALIGLAGSPLHIKEKLATGFFGIKGMGSFFYLAFALHEKRFRLDEELWATGAFVVLLSIIIHGLTATSVMEQLDTEFAEKIELQEGVVAAPEK